MTQKGAVILLNPVSGGFEGERLLLALQSIQRQDPRLVSIELIDRENLKSQIERAARYDLLIVAGGDGTLSSLLGLLPEAGGKIGLLPIGTGNDLARELGWLSKYWALSLSEYLEEMFLASSKKIALWELQYGANFSERVIFSNYCSIGFDAPAVERVQRWRIKYSYIFRPQGRILNRLAYLFAALLEFFQPPMKNCRVKSESDLAPQVISSVRTLFFSNIKSVMGFGFCNRVSSPEDDLIEFNTLGSVFDYGRMLLSGCWSFFAPPPRGSSKSWEIETQQAVAIQVDGEAMPQCRGKKFRIRFYGWLEVLA